VIIRGHGKAQLLLCPYQSEVVAAARDGSADIASSSSSRRAD